MVMAPLGKPDQPELSASAGFHVIPARCCLMSPDLQLQPAAGEEGLRQARHRFVQGSSCQHRLSRPGGEVAVRTET